MSNQRSGSGFGPNAIPFAEIAAWQAVTGQRLKGWERRAILAMDRAYLAAVQPRKEDDPDAPPDGPELTPEIFLAEFGRRGRS